MQPFVLYANCNVVYNGRATATLQDGNYLIIYKEDGTLLVHAGIDSPPRNYQTSKSQLTITDNQIISINKKDTLIITINYKITEFQPENWSNSKVVISKTEKDLVNKLCGQIGTLIAGYVTHCCEWPTDYGPIDILATDTAGIKHIIEVKRKTANIAAVSQLQRYVSQFEAAVGYLAAPGISKKAHKLLNSYNYKFVEVTF